jgi:glycine cleavage system H protein
MEGDFAIWEGRTLSMAIEKFTKEHEWIRVDGEVGTVGITDHAQGQLGDIVFVEVPEVGRMVAAHEACAVVESVKAASDVFSPVSGEVVDANGDLSTNPALVNEEAEGKAWFFKIRIANKAELDELMDKAAYDAFCKEIA